MSSCRVQVAVRVRPYLPRCDGADPSISILPNPATKQITAKASVDVPRDKRFEFDHVIDGNQVQLYDAIGAPMLKEALGGFNVCLFAFGSTGSGKTHSLLNSMMHAASETVSFDVSSSSCGLLPRLTDDLFCQLQQKIDENPQLSVKVSLSVVEIYMEKVRDLLVARNSCLPEPENLEIVDDNNKNNKNISNNSKKVIVKGLSEHNVLNSHRVKELISLAMANRQTAETKMNEVSSRSHFLARITVTQFSDSIDGQDLESTITIVDLGGSERQGKSETSRQTLEEGKKINLSLLTLGRALHSLSSQGGSRDVVSLRESKLTRLLGESLCGNSKTWMLATIAAASCHTQESLSTLEYATYARAIANKNVHVNVGVSREEIEEFRAQIGRLEETTFKLNKSIGQIEDATLQENEKMFDALNSLDALAAILKSREKSRFLIDAQDRRAAASLENARRQTLTLQNKSIAFKGSLTRKRVNEIPVDSLDYITLNLSLDSSSRSGLFFSVFSNNNNNNNNNNNSTMQASVEITVQRLSSTRYSIHVQDVQLQMSSEFEKNVRLFSAGDDCDEVVIIEKFKKIRGKVWLMQDFECFFPMKLLSVTGANNVLKEKRERIHAVKKSSWENNDENNKENSVRTTVNMKRVVTFPLSEQVGSNFSRVAEIPFLPSVSHPSVDFLTLALEIDC